MRNLLKSKKGFTLVEIVIVIAIIGILAMTLIPAVADTLKSRRLQAATEKARAVANLMVTGIESGQIPTTEGQATKLGLTPGEGVVLITDFDSEDPKDITTVCGIEKMYNNPTENADLKDPMSRDVNVFKIGFDDEAKTISIHGADPSGEEDAIQLYVTTSPLTIFAEEDDD